MLSLIEEEYEGFTENRSWKAVFDKIQNEARVMHTLSSKHARSPENRDRNRYRDVSPYDDYRVKLESTENNYINASLVEVALAGRTYILTQGPLANTAGHFWLMIWQQNSRGVLMLNKIIEDGRLKCHPYFPMGAEFDGDDSLTYNDVDLRVDYVSLENRGYFVIRTLNLINLKSGEEKQVLQFHYLDWPDFGTPENSESFLAFLYAVRQSGVIPPPHTSSQPAKAELGPPVIHCSAGIGRSGTFCLVDSALILVERTKTLASLDICSMLIDMRKYRCGLIQRPEQLRFSYMAILDGAQAILTSPLPSPDDQVEEHNVESDQSEDDLSAIDSMSEDEDDLNTKMLGDTSKNTSGEVPPPPVRTTSLATSRDESPAGADADSPRPVPSAHIAPESVPAPTPESASPTTQAEVATEDLTNEEKPAVTAVGGELPKPPKRTSSLHKSMSLDEPVPPPVPPLPPSTLDRQVSAPPSPNSASASGKDTTDAFDEEDEYRYESNASNPMKRKRELREKLDSMVAKQRAAEAARDKPFYRSWRFVVCAGVAAGLAAAYMFLEPYMFGELQFGAQDFHRR